MIDTAAERLDTPGCSAVMHLNHAGSSLMSREVLDTQVEHLRAEAMMGGYEAKNAANDRVEAVYRSAAELVGGTAGEIALVENATVGWQHAFYALTRTAQRGQRILTSRVEYGANVVAFLQRAAELGLTIEVLPTGDDGAVDASAMPDVLGDDVALVAVSHVPTNGGLVNPAEEVGAACRDAGVPYLLDACQSAGQLPLDVSEIGCSALTATSRKFIRGPRGAGFLWVDHDVLNDGLEPIVLDHHAAIVESSTSYRLQPNARRFENWEFNYAAVLGMGVAIDHALELGLEAIDSTVSGIAANLRQRLGSIAGVRVHDMGTRRCGICTFTVYGVEANDAKAALAAAGVNVSTSLPDSTILDAEHRSLPVMVRASVHYLTTDAELDRLCEVVAGL